MKPRTLLGTALVTTVSAALAVGTQVPSYTEPSSAVAVDQQARTAAVDSAQEYVGDHRSLFRASAGDAFQRVSTTAGSAGTHYVAYERTHEGLPVVGGDFVLAVNDDGKVTGRTLAQEKKIALDSLTPAVTAASARKAARAEVAQVQQVGKPELVVYAQGTPRLAWQTLVTGREAG